VVKDATDGRRRDVVSDAGVEWVSWPE
jgi:hypothetical protein